MNIIQFWIVDTIVKVAPKDQEGVIQDQPNNDHVDNEREPLLPK
jgi:hypothetical protein